MSIRLDRLADVATVLEGVPDERFQMLCWLSDTYTCGTVGCAIGWYVVRRGEAHGFSIFRGMPSYHGVCGFEAVAKFMSISVSDAAWMFDAESYGPNPRLNPCGYWFSDDAAVPTRAEVIARIRAFIADHQPAPVVEMKPERTLGEVAR